MENSCLKELKKMVVLTDAGEKMLNYTHKLLSVEEEVVADITGKREPAGTIRLMVPEIIASCHFPSITSELATKYPTITFDINNCSANSLEAIKNCVMKDIGLTTLPKNSVRKELHKNLLTEINWISDFETSVLMVWPKDKRIFEALHAFMEIIRRLKTAVV